MSSRQSQVLAAAVASLNTAGLSAFRCRFTPFSAAELPATNVLPEEEQPDYDNTDDLDLRFKFVVRHTAAAVDAVDVAVDANYITGAQALLTDHTLGGLVRFIRYAGRKWEFERAELKQVAMVVTYEVEFSTSRTDPSVAGF